jgi:hypothetical protein
MFDNTRYKKVGTEWFFRHDNGKEYYDPHYEPDLDGYVPVVRDGKVVYVKEGRKDVREISLKGPAIGDEKVINLNINIKYV